MRTTTLFAVLVGLLLVPSTLRAEDEKTNDVGDVDEVAEATSDDGGATGEGESTTKTWGEWVGDKAEALTREVNEIGKFLGDLVSPSAAEAATADPFEGDKQAILDSTKRTAGNAWVCPLGSDGVVSSRGCEVRRLERRNGQAYGCSSWGCLPIKEPATPEFVYDARGNPYLRGSTPLGSPVGGRPAELPRR